MEKTLRIGDVDWLVVDDGVAPVVPSLITEGRMVNGILYLSLAQTVVDGQGPPEAHICARLRLDIVSAQILRNTLSEMIDEAQKQPDTTKAN